MNSNYVTIYIFCVQGTALIVKKIYIFTLGVTFNIEYKLFMLHNHNVSMR